MHVHGLNTCGEVDGGSKEGTGSCGVAGLADRIM